MLDALTQSNSIEVVGQILNVSNGKAVLSTTLDYFLDRDLSEIIDGEFHVVGKVNRIIGSESSDVINLLRKTSFGWFDPKLFEQLSESLISAEEIGLKVPDVITLIKGPAIQVIPIAIIS